MLAFSTVEVASSVWRRPPYEDPGGVRMFGHRDSTRPAAGGLGLERLAVAAPALVVNDADGGLAAPGADGIFAVPAWF